MVFSYYLVKFPYQFAWYALKYTKLSPALSAYCAEQMDYSVLSPVTKYLPSMLYLAKNRQVARYLLEKTKHVKRMPVFPQAVIMARHATWRFPEPRIKKIGFRHGAFHFKNFIDAKAYNAFDVYFMSSEEDNYEARKVGIHSGVPIGYPKLDPAFDGTWTSKKLAEFSRHLEIDQSKRTILFSATWDKSGMSAVDQWYQKIDEFLDKFNILVTLHPFMSNRYKQVLIENEKIHYIHSSDLLPYLLLADVLVGDYSSILADFCALDKPIITFKVPTTERSVPKITEMISSFSLRIDNTAALGAAIDHCLTNPGELHKQRQDANSRMFSKLDGKAGLRAARYIQDMLNIKQEF